MECQSLLMCAHLLGPALDPDEVRYGQLLALVTGLSLLLGARLIAMLFAFI